MIFIYYASISNDSTLPGQEVGNARDVLSDIPNLLLNEIQVSALQRLLRTQKGLNGVANVDHRFLKRM